MRSCSPSSSAPGVSVRFLTAAFLAAFGAFVAAQGQPAQPPAQNPPAQGKPAQSPPATGQEQRPTFRAETNFVRVDVYPTADGKPVMDLKQDEFEVLEDGVPQEIRSFEHVVVQNTVSQEGRVEPNTVRQSRDMVAESKARLFVLFIDTYHITTSAAMNVRSALIRTLDKAIGPDDMIAVMTPEMSASSITFARRTQTIQEMLERAWRWGKRESVTQFDPIEEQYIQCYPATPSDRGSVSAVAREMINRRRERLTLEAFQELVVHLGGLREERKAVLAISEGWLLYTQDSSLSRSSAAQSTGSMMGSAKCDVDRAVLSMEDHSRDFRNLLDDANRNNVSFYPVDPRGLVVFDSSIGSDEFLGVVQDASRLRARLDSLQTIAGATDGIAIVNSNDIEKGLRRVVDDLTSYYLLGYNSTNGKTDGKFRAISVKVKRPRVDVRHRRGYRASTKEEVDQRSRAVTAAAAPPTPVASAVSSLSKIRSDATVQAQAGYSWMPGSDGKPTASLWVFGEFDSAVAARDEQWKNGADVTVVIAAPDKTPLEGSTQKTLTKDARGFSLRVSAGPSATAGEYTVRITTKPAGTSLGSTETIRVFVPKAPSADTPAAGQPMFYRRGPFSGPNWQPAGDLRFRRQERVRVEVPLVGDVTSTAVRLLDRTGNPLGIPVTAAERVENGVKFVTGEVVLAPLSAGDFVLEISYTFGSTTQKALASFRIVP